MCNYSLNKKIGLETKKEQTKYQAIVLDLQNYISTCHFNNLHIVHPNFCPISQEPTIESSPF
jgi:hypothetical protein